MKRSIDLTKGEISSKGETSPKKKKDLTDEKGIPIFFLNVVEEDRDPILWIYFYINVRYPPDFGFDFSELLQQEFSLKTIHFSVKRFHSGEQVSIAKQDAILVVVDVRGFGCHRSKFVEQDIKTLEQSGHTQVFLASAHPSEEGYVPFEEVEFDFQNPRQQYILGYKLKEGLTTDEENTKKSIEFLRDAMNARYQEAIVSPDQHQETKNNLQNYGVDLTEDNISSKGETSPKKIKECDDKGNPIFLLDVVEEDRDPMLWIYFHINTSSRPYFGFDFSESLKKEFSKKSIHFSVKEFRGGQQVSIAKQDAILFVVEARAFTRRKSNFAEQEMKRLEEKCTQVFLASAQPARGVWLPLEEVDFDFQNPRQQYILGYILKEGLATDEEITKKSIEFLRDAMNARYQEEIVSPDQHQETKNKLQYYAVVDDYGPNILGAFKDKQQAKLLKEKKQVQIEPESLRENMLLNVLSGELEDKEQNRGAPGIVIVVKQLRGESATIVTAKVIYDLNDFGVKEKTKFLTKVQKQEFLKQKRLLSNNNNSSSDDDDECEKTEIVGESDEEAVGGFSEKTYLACNAFNMGVFPLTF